MKEEIKEKAMEAIMRGIWRELYSCKKCNNKIKNGQNVFMYEGNLYHDYCSQELEGRECLRKC